MDQHIDSFSMDYLDQLCEEPFQTLSRCGLGALLVARNKSDTILKINEAGVRLLHGTGLAEGSPLPGGLAGLLDPPDNPSFCRVAYGEYVVRQEAEPFPGLPEGLQLIVFRDAAADHLCTVLGDVVSRLTEGVVISDEDGRLYYCNAAASRMDSIVAENELGEKIDRIYRMEDGSECPLPQVVRTHAPLLNYRQRYATRHGKSVDAVANTWPVLRHGRALGAFNLLEDWSTVNALHKQIIDLQEKLTAQASSIDYDGSGHSASSGTGKGRAGRDGAQKGAGSRARAKSPLTARYTFADIICADKKMCKVVKQCKQVARTDSSVIIYGETGTGKELFAQSIHNASPRRDGPFLAINCAALPENLLESLLFGSVKGAYTGAENRAGLFEQANHGTLLLDEINSMNISLQAKLLRVLQEGTVRRVGGTAETPIDVRVLSCTNVPPRQAVAEGKMREDLFYRLGVVGINIPPLRERKADIPLLVSHFIADCNATMMRRVRSIDDVTMEIFQAYSWPGNVRELQHAIEHAMNILPDPFDLITPEYIPQNLLSDEEIAAAPVPDLSADRDWQPYDAAGTPEKPAPAEPGSTAPGFAASDPAYPDAAGPAAAPSRGAEAPTGQTDRPLQERLQNVERQTLCKVLAENKGNISRSARILHMSRQNLQYRIKRYGINVEDFR